MMGFFQHGGRGCHPGHERHGMGPRGGFGRHGGRHGGWGGRGRGGFGGGDEGEGRRGRMFDGGELRLVLLKLIADQPRHGYDLIRQVEELTGGAYAPSPGVVYPTLTLLGDMGLIEERQAEGARKQFAVTEAGTQHLAENREQVDALVERLSAIGARQARTETHSVRRAMINLGLVLRNRLGAEQLDDTMLQQTVALIDETAQKIERL